MAPLSRRALLRALGVGAAGVAFGGGCRSADRGGERPNVVLIVADDMGYECVRANGGTSYATPRLDALAAEGARFTRAFCTPVCTPSRVQLMSGEYPFRTGWTEGIWRRPREAQIVDPSLFLLPRAFRAAGYATLAAGKWQLARLDDHPEHPKECGFDEQCLWIWRIGDRHPSRYWKPVYWQNGEVRTELENPHVFGPDLDAAYVVDFARRHRERPFFVYHATTLPHPPFVAPPGNYSRDQGVALFPSMVSYFDDIVGRVVDAIDGLGLGRRTLVLVTADNGTAGKVTSALGGRKIRGGKHRLNDAGTHVPMIARWTGTIAPSVRDELVDLTDVAPTIAEATALALPSERKRDGRSFWKRLRGEAGDGRPWVFLQKGSRFAVRGPRWKLYDDGSLVDVASDPVEEAAILPEKDTPESTAARAELRRAIAELGLRAPG